MPVTSEQIDELIRQMKIANQIQLANFLREARVNPVRCIIDEEATRWNDLFDSITSLTQYLNV